MIIEYKEAFGIVTFLRFFFFQRINLSRTAYITKGSFYLCAMQNKGFIIDIRGTLTNTIDFFFSFSLFGRKNGQLA